MKKILLTNSNKKVLVDDEDYERLRQHSWYYDKATGSIFHSCTFLVRMSHKIIQTDKHIDHKDGNRLNHQKANLRECTCSQNNQNRRKRKNSSSMYKGVYSANGKWRTGIRIRNTENKQVYKHLGLFEIEKEAAGAYDEAARYYFGEFAALNFPKEGEQSCQEKR